MHRKELLGCPIHHKQSPKLLGSLLVEEPVLPRRTQEMVPGTESVDWQRGAQEGGACDSRDPPNGSGIEGYAS